MTQVWHTRGAHQDLKISKEPTTAEGNTLPSNDPGAFQHAMEAAFYGPLANLTVPARQRFFATKNLLPDYPELIAALRQQGG